MTFKIYYLNSKDTNGNHNKYLKLKPDYGLRGYRYGITSIVTDILLTNRPLKSRLGYYHDGNVELFLTMLPKWLNAYYNACENKDFMGTSLAFSPIKEKDLDIKEIKTIRKDSYKSIIRFLEDFFSI